MKVAWRKKLDWLELLSIVIFTAIALVYMSNVLQTNLGILDESLMLSLAHNSDTSVSYAGIWSFYTHIIYAVTAGDVYTFRVLGAILLFVSSLLFGYLLVRDIAPAERFSRPIRITAILAIGVTGLDFYTRLLFVPGYDWLALVGVTGALCGYLLTRAKSPTQIRFGAILIGIFGFLASAGRPIAGIGFISIFLIDLFFVRRCKDAKSITKLLTASALLAAIFHFVFIANLKDTINSLLLTLRISEADPSHSPLTLIKVTFWQVGHVARESIVLSKGLILVIVILPFVIRKYREKFSSLQIRFVAAFLFVSVIALSVFYPNTYLAAVWVSLVITYASMYVVFQAESQVNDSGENDSSQVSRLRNIYSYILVFIGSIFCITFTSNIGVVVLASHLMLLFIALMYVFAFNADEPFIRNFSQKCTTVVTIVFLFSGYQAASHFQGHDISKESVATYIGPNNSLIFLNKEQSGEINQIRAFKSKNLIAPNTKVLSLTPYAIYIGYELDFRYAETPYIVQGQKYAEEYVQRNKEALNDAWMFTTSDVSRYEPVDPKPVVTILNKTFPQDYKLMASFTGRYCVPKVCTINLWKPLR